MNLVKAKYNNYNNCYYHYWFTNYCGDTKLFCLHWSSICCDYWCEHYNYFRLLHHIMPSYGYVEFLIFHNRFMCKHTWSCFPQMTWRGVVIKCMCSCRAYLDFSFIISLKTLETGALCIFRNTHIQIPPKSKDQRVHSPWPSW